MKSVDDFTTTVEMKAVCKKCGHILSEFEYGENVSLDNGFAIQKYYFSPMFCPNCKRKIESLQIPLPKRLIDSM